MMNFNNKNLDNLPISKLKRICDYWLRRYLIRHADKNVFGKIYCPIKKKFIGEKYVHVSHFIDRGVMCTRYDLNNVMLISKKSNVWDSKILEDEYKSKHHKEYEKVLKDKIGEKKLNELKKLSNKNCIFGKDYYIEKINF